MSNTNINSLENKIKSIKPLKNDVNNKNNLKEYPNDSINLNSIIKYIRIFSPHPIRNFITEPGENYSPIKKKKNFIKNSKLNQTHFDINRLTINNNTNISNLNLYFLYNSVKFNSSMQEKRKNLKPVRKKEPEDNISRKISDTNLKKKPKDFNQKRDNKFKRFHIIKKEIKDENSKSALNSIEKNTKILRKENPHTLGEKSKNLTNPGILKVGPNSKLILSEFTIINQIGKGTFGKIFSVKWKKNGKKYALKKEIFNDLEIVEKRKNVIKIIKDFLIKTNVKGVIHIYSNLCEKKNNEYNYYELMEIGEIDWEKEIIARSKNESYYSEGEIFNIASQLIKALSLLQKNKITHRDIKPQNILIVNGQYKLCDFGEIRIMKREGIVVQSIRGSELYMSPILFFGLRNGLIQVKHNTYKSDVYSLGMCLLYAASMHYSGTDAIREMTDMKQINETLNQYLSERYSNKFISLIYLMLETDEKLRPDFIQLEEKLNNLIS